jgi:hypothetical protein
MKFTKKNGVARLEVLKNFEVLKRKFNPRLDDRIRLQLSYLREDLTPYKLIQFVERHNTKHPQNFHYFSETCLEKFMVIWYLLVFYCL